MLSDFIDWYVAMLRSAMPAGLRAWLAGGRGGLVVTASLCGRPEQALVTAVKRGRERSLGTLGGLLGRNTLSAQKVTIRLPGAAILDRETTLPLAVERSLATALAHEMDRLTPFDAGEVLWHADILRRDRDAGTLRLRLAIMPRRRVAGLLDLLAAAKLAVVAVEGGSGALRTIPLGAGRHGRGAARRAGMIAAALALLCLLIPPVRQQIAFARIDQRMAAMAPALHRAEAMRGRLKAEAAGRAALRAEARREGYAMRALAEITGILPDGSYLTDFALHDGVATLDGLSPDAARLIARFAGNPDFADPGFAAPVTKAPDTRSDMFMIRVRLRADAGGGAG